ncbi:MAG: hypothetical protein AAF773_23585, partial [Cyanobacteria bacterium P01_D01_bin.115]
GRSASAPLNKLFQKPIQVWMIDSGSTVASIRLIYLLRFVFCGQRKNKNGFAALPNLLQPEGILTKVLMLAST